MTSFAISPFTMPAALAAGDRFLGHSTEAHHDDEPTWSGDPDNRDQMRWLAHFRRRARVAAGVTEIRSNATTSALDHVAWLAAEGWDAQLPSGSPDDLFLAATLNIVAKWVEPGHAYMAGHHRALLKKGATATEGAYPVVRVTTQHPDFVFCFQQRHIDPIGDHDELAKVAHEISRPSQSAHDYDTVHLDFPMVDLRVKDDARYILGLHSGPNVVTQAAEQIRLELNEVGGRASAAAEFAVKRGFVAGPRVVRIDGPFVVAVAFRRESTPSTSSLDRVVFAAYCDRDSWMRPADGRIL